MPRLPQPASIQEARAHIDLSPCQCGSRLRRAEVLSFEVEDPTPELVLDFECGGCGAARSFTFDIGLFYPDGGPVGASYSLLPQASRLLDPIQYFHIAYHHIRHIPADLGALDGQRELDKVRQDAAWALAALVEADKFMMTGPTQRALHPTARWSQDSKRLFEAHPERYTGTCLLEHQHMLCEVIDALAHLSQALVIDGPQRTWSPSR